MTKILRADDREPENKPEWQKFRRESAHFMVAASAKAIAREVFEVLASKDPQFYRMFGKPGTLGDMAAFRFAELNWPNWIEAARAALELFHDQPDTPEATRVQIREALVLDRTLDGRMFDGTHIGDIH